MRLGNRHRAPTALGALLLIPAATLIGCGDSNQADLTGGTSGVPAPNQPTPGRAGTMDDIDGRPGGDAAADEVANSSHEPTGTYLDPEPIDSPTGGATSVELPGSSGASDAAGAAGAANAQGAAVGASSSPEEAAGTGASPAGSNAAEQPDDSPTDDPVDARP